MFRGRDLHGIQEGKWSPYNQRYEESNLKTVKVMTFNMANYDDFKRWKERVQLMANMIINKQPDIILLQEVRMNPDESSTKLMSLICWLVLYELSQLGHYRNAFISHLPIMFYPIGTDVNVPAPKEYNGGTTIEWEGHSVISKFWIYEQGGLALTNPLNVGSDPNWRATQYCTIDITNGESYGPLFFNVYNTHFSLAKEAEKNAQETLELMKRRRKLYPNEYYIMGGDLNATPNEAPIKILKEDGMLTDLWEYMWGNTERGYTWKSNEPMKRIDYLFTSELLSKSCKKLELVGSESDDGLFASDHFGVMATFSIPIDVYGRTDMMMEGEESEEVIDPPLSNGESGKTTSEGFYLV